MTPEQHVYSVSELNRTARQRLEETFGGIWVKGEIAEMTRAASGHIYFTLKDADAEISAVRFRSRSGLQAPVTVERGMTVLAFGRLTVYEPRGRYQFVAELLQPVGAGALQAAFERLKKKLLAEGLFEAEHKTPLPAFPKRIGVVTSPSGAAIQDVVSVLSRRWPSVSVVLFPSAVQGATAPAELCTALDQAVRFSETRERLDVVILTRGGGSAEDLAAFNDEAVARAVFACPIPVISAVGHEIDLSISDLVADHRAPTPSAAAEVVVPDAVEIVTGVTTAAARQTRAMASRFRTQESALQITLRASLLRIPQRRIETGEQHLDQLLGRVMRAVSQRLKGREDALSRLSDVLRLSDPRLPLQRGYSLTYAEGSDVPVRDATTMTPGTKIRTMLSSGQLTSRIEEVIPE